MKEEEKKTLKEALESSYKIQDDFFDFQLQTKTQLLLSQLQFTQSLGGISLALVAIGVSTQTIGLSLWSCMSIGFATALLVYSSSAYREIIDLQARDLEETDESLRETQGRVQESIIKSFRDDDFNIYLTHLREEVSRSIPSKPHSYQMGEIVVFLFFNTLGFGLLSILDSEIICFPRLFMILLILTISYLSSFKNWSQRLTSLLSKSFGE